jgi:hypothetical protein
LIVEPCRWVGEDVGMMLGFVWGVDYVLLKHSFVMGVGKIWSEYPMELACCLDRDPPPPFHLTYNIKISI